MPDFQFVQSPVFTPTSCATCSTHHDKKGFVDLLVDTPVGGRLYMCGTCAETAGRKLGMLSREQATDLTRRLARAQEDLAAAYKSLEHEKANKSISLADARKLLKAGS